MKNKYNWENKTILVVDDEYMNYLLFEAILEETNSKVIHAMNGEIAIEVCLSNTNIDLVLMDLKMPVVNGYEATKIIKEKRKNLPIIAQTAYTASEDYNKCMNAGFDEYIPKPVERELFLFKLNSFLEDSAMTQN
ncbi:MAG: response regulator [Bacteroidales bacterium]|nr:response regulator [Bacteroidales bacterium]